MNKVVKEVETFVEQHEQTITVLLVVVAVILFLVAFFGRPSHKAAALLYIVL